MASHPKFGPWILFADDVIAAVKGGEKRRGS